MLRNSRLIFAAITVLLAGLNVYASTPAFQLLDMLEAGSDQARAQARQLLPRENVEVVPRLVALLNSDNPAVRLTAFNVLADFANMVSVPGREDDRAAVTASLLTLLEPDKPAAIKELGLRLLPVVVAKDADISTVAALMHDSELREKARAALVEMGTTQARTALCEGLSTATPEFACALLDGLGQLKDAASLEAIAACAQSDAPAVRAAAARALAWTGDPARLELVRQVMARADDATRGDAVDAWLRLVRAMEVSGGNWSIAVREYTAMAGSDQPKLRVAGLAGLGRVGDGTCVAPILATLQKGDAIERGASLEALRQMRGVDVCREIVNTYSSVPADIKAELILILGGKRNELALGLLAEAARSDDAKLRAAGLAALGDLALPQAVEPLVAACAKGDVQDRTVAREALVRLGDLLRSTRHASAAGGAYLAALTGSPLEDQALLRRAVSGLIASPSVQAFDIAKQLAADTRLRDLAVPLLIAVGDKMVESKQKEKAAELYQAAMDLKPGGQTIRTLAEKMSRIGSPIDWAAQMGIVRHWWLVGPFELGEQNVGWAKRYVDEPNVDLRGRYMSGMRRHEWRPVVADDERGVVNMAAALGQVDNAIGYAYAEIEVPAETDAVLRVGVDDSERIWLNGRQVFELWAARGLTIDADNVPVKLQAGTNRILMKIWQNTMGWEFCLRVTTPDGQPVAFSQKAP